MKQGRKSAEHKAGPVTGDAVIIIEGLSVHPGQSLCCLFFLFAIQVDLQTGSETDIMG